MTDVGLKKASVIVGYVDVNGLNEFFMSQGPNAGGVAFSVLFHDFTPFSFRSVSAQEVAAAVFSIKSEAIGLDNVFLKFVKLLDPSLIPHITNFLNFCFIHDKFPEVWKVSKILPLPKISNPSDFLDYRPIAMFIEDF
jgi:hypothetical protein